MNFYILFYLYIFKKYTNNIIKQPVYSFHKNNNNNNNNNQIERVTHLGRIRFSKWKQWEGQKKKQSKTGWKWNARILTPANQKLRKSLVFYKWKRPPTVKKHSLSHSLFSLLLLSGATCPQKERYLSVLLLWQTREVTLIYATLFHIPLFSILCNCFSPLIFTAKP